MKKNCRPFFAVSLYVALALLLCLGSCQSNDNAKTGEGVSVSSLALTVLMGEASSRVSMSDTYGGDFSCSWDSDQLNIYHPYVLNGAVQSMTPLTFSTTETSGISATFSYIGTDAYRYNPGMWLYAFSKETSGNYTTSVTEDGKSTLTATTLASQKGTLADCAKYDALYGSATVDYGTGLPGSLVMHHLFGMLNLHLTSNTFSTNYPVTVTLTSSASNILPGNDGNATLNADGSLGSLTGSWGTNWSTIITPTTNGVIDVYFMTWPFNAIGGTLTVSCSDASGNTYIDRQVTLSGFSLAAAQIKSKPLAIANATYSNLYAWDAIDYQPVTLNTAATNANITNVASSETDYSNGALYACKNCPTYCEISWYLSVDCYWDNGSINGGNTTNYKLANGNYTKAGMWFRQKSGISGFSSTIASTTTSRYPIALSSSLASSLNLARDYFFLPATGYADYKGVFFAGGPGGYYWSSTPCTSTDIAYYLHFLSSVVSLNSDYRHAGFCLWQGQ